MSSFRYGPDSKVKENDEGNDEPEGSGGACVRFRADIESELEDNEPRGICLEDPRLARGEEARQLDVERGHEDPRWSKSKSLEFLILILNLTLVWYQEMRKLRVFDAATIDCVVGRVNVGNR